MPRRITVDENGLVVSLENVPDRDFPTTPKRRAGFDRTTKQKAKPRTVPGREAARPPLVTVPRIPPYRSGNLPVRCPACKVGIKEKNLKRHLRKVHPDVPVRETPAGAPEAAGSGRSSRPGKKGGTQKPSPALKAIGKPLVRCPDCGANVREHNLQKHLRKVHSAAACGPKPKTAKKPARPAGNSRRGASSGVFPDPDERGRAIRDLSEETSFGDKYLGQVRREADGRFGSLPLYDDYGEESGPA